MVDTAFDDKTSYCRLCADDTVDTLIGIYSDEGSNYDLATKITRYLPVCVTMTDRLSLLCCLNCTTTVLNWHELVLRCIETDKRLTAIVGKDGGKTIEDSDGADEVIIDVDDEDEEEEEEELEEVDPYDDYDDDEEEECNSGAGITIGDEDVNGGDDDESEEGGDVKLIPELFDGGTLTKKEMEEEEVEEEIAENVKVEAIFDDLKNKNDTSNVADYCIPDQCATTSNGDNSMTAATSNNGNRVKTVATSNGGDRKRRRRVATLHSDEFKRKAIINDRDDGTRTITTPSHLQPATFNEENCEPSRNKPTATSHSEDGSRLMTTTAATTPCNGDDTLRNVAPSKENQEDDDTNTTEPPVAPSIGRRSRPYKLDKDAIDSAKVIVDGRCYYNCQVCGKCLYSPYTYAWHTRIHTGERPYVCDLCGKQFRVSQGLVRHLKETHEGIKRFTCDICGRKFATKRNVDEHRRIHTNERPYVCDLCGKSFKQKASLFVHNRSHSDTFPYRCTYCDQGFRTRPTLLLHVTRHTGEKPYPCDVCGRCFRIKYELKRHKLIHSDVKPFSCNECGLKFRQKRYLRNHNKTNHK